MASNTTLVLTLRPTIAQREGSEIPADVKSKSSIPKDLRIPWLLIVLCCFANQASYVTEFSTFAIFFIRNTMAEISQLVDEINLRLGKQHIALSSEQFSLFRPQDWAEFKLLWKDSGRCMLTFVLHRRTSARLVSVWKEIYKFRPDPVPIGQFLLSMIPQLHNLDENGHSDEQLKILYNAMLASNQGVVAAQYEYWQKTNVSFVAFLMQCDPGRLPHGRAWLRPAEIWCQQS